MSYKAESSLVTFTEAETSQRCINCHGLILIDSLVTERHTQPGTVGSRLLARPVANTEAASSGLGAFM
jgi:hypothetical protein